MFTLEDLKKVKPLTIFAKGVVEDSPKGINMLNTKRMLKWVAARGDVYDWAVYAAWDDENSYTSVVERGDKIIGEANIRRVVPCTDEVFKKYRY